MLWGAAAFRLSGLLFKDVAGRFVDVTGLGSELILWGIDITPLLATAGIAGLAVAFAAKDTIANIILDSGERGDVVAIPNSIIANTKIINESAPMPKLKIAEENEYVAKDPIREDSSTQ